MRKIVVLSHRDIKHKEGGGAKLYVHEIFKRLVTNYDVTILSTGRPGLPSRERVDGINIVRIPFPTMSRFALPFSFLTRMTGRADIVVDNGDVVAPWLTPIYVRKPLISIIYQVMANIFQYELPASLANIAQKIEPWIYQIYRRTRIVACSPSTRSDLVHFGIPSDKISVIRPGIADSFIRFRGDGRRFDNPTIICVSRFRRYKGLRFAIAAMEHVLKRVPDARLIIAGSGDDSEIRREISKTNYGDAIQILNRLPHTWEDEKKVLLSRSHVALVPSVREGYGIVVLEANACGTPAIGWRVGGIKDSILDEVTGVLVPFNDVEELGEQISNILEDDQKREEMASRAVNWARTHSWDKASREFADVIDSL